MKVYDAPQGTEQWFRDRAGVITASMFEETRKRVNGLTPQWKIFVDLVRKGLDEVEAATEAGYAVPAKQAKTLLAKDVVQRALRGEAVGDFTEKALAYAFRLAVERISGEPLDDEMFQTYSMKRGNNLEPAARLAHEERKGILVVQAGFITDDLGIFGASLDGLIDEYGSSEYKCLIDPARIRTILLDKNLDQFADQMQGGLWLSNRDYCDFGLYCPTLKSIGKELTLRRVERDEEYIINLKTDLHAFNRLVENYKQQIIDSE